LDAYVIRIISAANGDGEKFIIYRPEDDRNKASTILTRLREQLNREPVEPGLMSEWLDEQPEANKQHERCYLVDKATCALFRLWWER
jgi:hypothetical protein